MHVQQDLPVSLKARPRVAWIVGQEPVSKPCGGRGAARRLPGELCGRGRGRAAKTDPVLHAANLATGARPGAAAIRTRELAAIDARQPHRIRGGGLGPATPEDGERECAGGYQVGNSGIAMPVGL